MPKLIERTKVGLRLVGCALGVIRRHRKLLVFPLLTLACVGAVMLFFAAPMVLLPTGHPFASEEHWTTLLQRLRGAFARDGQPGLQGWAYVYVVAVYLGSMITATFLNVAFYHEIMRALADDRVSLVRGLRVAGGKLRAILFWSLLAATVGLVIQALAERLGWLGRWVLRMVGMAWSVASMFAIPALIRGEETNPFAVLRNSAATLKKSWGEAVGGYVGLKAGTMVVVLGWLALMAVAMFGAAFLGKVGALLLVLAILGAVLGSMAIFYLSMVADHVYICALYVYASEGVVPGPFTAEQLDAAWTVKQRPAL